jgi:hypothetical protein
MATPADLGRRMPVFPFGPELFSWMVTGGETKVTIGAADILMWRTQYFSSLHTRRNSLSIDEPHLSLMVMAAHTILILGCYDIAGIDADNRMGAVTSRADDSLTGLLFF